MRDYDKMVSIFAGYFRNGPADENKLISFSEWKNAVITISNILNFNCPFSSSEFIYQFDIINEDIAKGKYDI